MPARAINTVRIVETEGQEPLVSGGVSIAAVESETKSQDFVLPATLHLQGAHISWCGCKPGDYAYVEILAPDDTFVAGYNLQAGNPGANRGYWQLVGDSSVLIWNQNSVTAPIPVGFKLRAHLVTTAEAGSRCMAVNFLVRLPLE